MNTRRHLMLAAGATALAAQLPATASAQTFPSRPLRFIMPYPPGGSSEILARPIAQEMTKFFGQPVIVDFKPGAGSTTRLPRQRRWQTKHRQSRQHPSPAP